MRNTSILLVCFLLGLPPRCAHGATDAIGPVDEFADKLEAYSDKLEALPPSAPECRAPYSKVYAKDPLAISVFFGFIDTLRRNYVADGDFKQALIRHLTKVCRQQYQACGFTAVSRDPAIPNKITLVKSQNNQNVVINIFDSSVSSDYSACVTRLSGEQEMKSRMAEEEYLAALGQDAAVLYAGHSRYLTGPGFYPPLSFSRIGLAALFRRPLFSRMNDALRSSASPPAILGLFSCNSREYYAGRIHALAPHTSLLVSSDASSHENSLLSLLGAINLILVRPCYGEADQSINADKQTPVFHLYGLFDQLPHPHYTRYNDVLHVLIVLFFIPLLVILVSKWTKTGPTSWPARKPNGAWGGVGVLILSMVPCLVIARTFTDQTTTPLPLMLSLMGLLLLTVDIGRARISVGDLSAITRQALPFLLVFLLLYFCGSFIREISLDNALSALRQSMKFSLIFYLILPFVLLSEDVLLAPFLGKKLSGFIPSCILSLFFYVVLWLALCALAPVYKPALWPVVAFVLYNRTFSFLLYRRKPHFLIPAVFQAAAWALIFTEGIHGLIYR